MPLHGNPLGPVTKILVDTNVFHATALMEQCIELTRVRLGDVENEIRLLAVRPKNFTRQETADAPALAQEFPRHGVSGKALPAYEQESAALLDRFAELCKNANGGDEDKLLDVFHLWTAERAGIPYLLTYDARFVNFMTKTSRATLRTEPILPAALANRLGIDFEGSG